MRILGEASGVKKQVAAHVVLEQAAEDGPWRVTLVVKADGASRVRTFDTESCLAAADAVALILAIDVDPQVAMRAGGATAETAPAPLPTIAEPPPPPPPAWVPGPVPAPVPAVLPSATPSRRPSAANPSDPDFRLPFGIVVAASLATDSGSLPVVGVGASFGIGADLGHLRLELDGTYWGPQKATAPKGPFGASFQLGSGNLRAAYLFRLGRLFSLGPLLDAGLEGMGAQGFNGTVSNKSPTEFWAAIGAGGLATLRPFSHFAVRLVLEGELPVPRPNFIVQNPTPTLDSTVHRPSPLLGRAIVGVEAQFR